MVFAEDLGEFFDADQGFAIPATLDGADVLGILSVEDDPGDRAEGVSRRFWTPAASCPALPSGRAGLELRVDGVSYTAHLREVAEGVAELGLHLTRGQIVVGLMGHVADWQADANLAALLSTQAAYTLDGNALKWKFSWAGPGLFDYDWTTADASVQFATDYGLAYRGHSLLRGAADHYPAGYDFSTAATRQAHNATHIATTVGRYVGRILWWDVWNELLLASGDYKDFAGGDATTTEEIAAAYEAAALADPAAKLGLVDYGCETAGTKQDGLYALCQALLALGAPLHYVAFQAHLDADSSPSSAEWRATFKRFRGLGLDVHISELDVGVSGVAGSDAVKQEAQALAVRNLMAAARLEGVAVVGWWGAFDGKTWRPGEQPLPFDEAYQAKPAWVAFNEEI